MALFTFTQLYGLYQKFIFNILKSNNPKTREGWQAPLVDKVQIYSLRNNMLHESNPKIAVPSFTLFFSDGPIEFSRYSAGDIVNGKTVNLKHDDSINGRHLIRTIIKYTEDYYLDNKNKFVNIDFLINSNEMGIEQEQYDQKLQDLQIPVQGSK